MQPEREKRFHFSHTDPDGRVLEGVFLWRRPTLRDLLRIEAERVRLCEGQALEGEFLVLATFLARLKVVLREVPAWLVWDELDELALVSRLHAEVMRLEDAWFRRGDARGGGPGAGARAGANEAAGVPAAPLVGAEVSPPAHER